MVMRVTLGPVESPWYPQLYGIQTTGTSRGPIFRAFLRGLSRYFRHGLGHEFDEPRDVPRRRAATPMFGDRRGHQHVGVLVSGAYGLMRRDARILEHRIALHARVKNVFHRALDRLVHLRQRTVLRYVGYVARIPRMLLVRVRVDGREQAPDTLRAQVEGPLAVRRFRSVARDGDVRHIVSRPALRPLVPPDDGFRARIGLAVPVARRPVVEDAHVVGPGPPEARKEAEGSRFGRRGRG